MKDCNEEYMDKIDLLFTPLTKKLLIQYVSRKYEESADISDKMLKMELLWLFKNNLLSELIVCEFIYSELLLKSTSKYPTLYTN